MPAQGLELVYRTTKNLEEMKKTILSVFALTIMSTAAFAQTSATEQTAAQTTTQATTEEKQQVEESALPPAVKQTLSTDQYKDWKFVSGWNVKGANEHYILELQKGEERTTLKMDKEGKLI